MKSFFFKLRFDTKDIRIVIYYTFFSAFIKEDHKYSIFGVECNHYLPPNAPLVFATAGKNRIYIYECDKERPNIRLVDAYVDPDVSAPIFFFNCLGVLFRSVSDIVSENRSRFRIFCSPYTPTFNLYIFDDLDDILDSLF